MGAVSPHVDHKVISLNIQYGVSMLEITLNDKMCQREVEGGQKRRRVCKDAPSQQATTDAQGQCKC